jgi:hypothetical protein
MPTASQPELKPQRKWRRRFLILFTLVALPVVLAVSRSQSPAPSPPPTAAEALAARHVFERLRTLSKQSGAHDVALSWAELAGVSKLGGRALRINNAAVVQDGDRVRLTGSIRLPLGLWANVTGWASPASTGAPVLEGRVGALPLPPFVMKMLIGITRFGLRLRGIEVPPTEKLIQGLAVSHDGLIARLDLPRDSKLFQALNKAQLQPVDTAVVAALYCRMTAAQAAAPTPDFAQLVQQAVGNAGDDVAQNRAALVALAMVTVSPEAGRMAGDATPLIAKCLQPTTRYLMLGRDDLPKHWALSAALAAVYGTDISSAVGTWKEVSDSAPSGSGFSYVDLAADRSGSLVGARLSDPLRAPAMGRWLATAGQAQLLPIHDLALAEGMDEAEFTRRYESVESDAYGKVAARIDRALQKSMGR